jgi:hypothetical protein
MDYSKLTDAQLLALDSGDFSQLSDDEVLQLSQMNVGNEPQQAQPSAVTPSQDPSDPYADTVVDNSMHPELSGWDRFVVKNFASNPNAGIGYLQKEYPDMEFRKTRDGEIVAKKPNDPHFYRLDEKGFGLQDYLDHTADVGQGIADGVGMTAGALGTAASLTNPITAPLAPFVMPATNAAVGGATESAKQGIGTLLGVPNNVDYGNIATSATLNAAMPVVGDGIKAGWNKAKDVAPKVGSYLSGYSEDLIRNINKDREARELISKIGPTQYVDNFRNNLTSGMDSAKNQFGKNVELATGNNPVNISGVKDDIAQFMGVSQNPRSIHDLMSNPRGPTVTSDFTDEMRQAAGYIPEKLNSKPDNISAQEARGLKNYLFGISQDDKSVLGYGATQAQMGDITPTERMVSARGSEGIRNAMREASPNKEAFDVANKEASDFYGTYYNKKMKPFNDQDSTLKFMEAYGNPKSPNAKDYRKEFFDDVKNYTAMGGREVDVDAAARGYQSANVFNDPAKFAMNGKAATIGSGLGGAIAYGSGLGAGPGIALGLIGGAGANFVASPWAMKKTAEVIAPGLENAGEKAARYIYKNPYMRTDRVLENILMNENQR